MKVAIVGAGIAGLGAARALAGRHEVTLFEAAARPGGHVYTVEAGGVAVDMGFIVCNRERYPLFFRMLGELGVATRPTTMSFSVSLPARRARVGQREPVGAVRGSPAAGRSRATGGSSARCSRFLRRARRDLEAGAVAERSLDEYVARAPPEPPSSAIGSSSRSPPRCGRSRPIAAASSRPRPTCGSSTSTGCCGPSARSRGARSSAAAGATSTRCSPSCARRRCTLHLATPVAAVASRSRGRHGGRRAGASTASIASSSRPTPTPRSRCSPRRRADERRVLGAFRYSANRTVLHTRSRVPAAPPRRARVVELRRRSGHRAGRGHLLDDAAAGPARRRAVPRHAQPAHARRATSLHEVMFAHPAARSRRARRPGASCRGSAGPSARTTRARTSGSASTRTACAPGSPPRRACSPTSTGSRARCRRRAVAMRAGP